jgi:hypothetical protein
MKRTLVGSALKITVALGLVPSLALAVTPPPDVPDAGSSALLLGAGAIGLYLARRFLVRRR